MKHPSQVVTERFWRFVQPYHLSEIYHHLKDVCHLAAVRYEQDGLMKKPVQRQSVFTFGGYRNTVISKKLLELNGRFHDLFVTTRPIKGCGYEYLEVVIGGNVVLTISSTNGPLHLPRPCGFRKQNCQVNPKVTQLSCLEPVEEHNTPVESAVIPVNFRSAVNGLVVFGSSLLNPFTFAHVQLPDHEYTSVLGNIDLYRYVAFADTESNVSENTNVLSPTSKDEDRVRRLRLKDIPEQDPEQDDDTGSGDFRESGGDDLG